MKRIIPLLVLLAGASTASAFYNDFFTNGNATGIWNDAGNWNTGGIPTNGPANAQEGHIWVHNNNTVNINANANTWILHVGWSGSTGTVNLNSGTLDLQPPDGQGSTLRMGRDNSAGIFNMAAGTTLQGRNLEMGGWNTSGGAGDVFNHNGGTANFSWALIGRNGPGTYTMNGGTMNLSNGIEISRNASTARGTLEVNPGATINTGSFASSWSGSIGTTDLAGGTINSTGNVLFAQVGSTAHVVQSAGAWNATGDWFEVAPRSGGNATYIITGGTITHTGAQWLVVGANGGSGTLAVSNGSAITANRLLVGNSSGSAGVVTFSDNASFSTSGELRLGNGGSASVTQQDSATVRGGTLNLYTADDSYNLQGGTLGINTINMNSGAFTWNGATLTTREIAGNVNNGSTDFSDNSGGQNVLLGTQLDVNGDLTSAGANTLDLGNLYLNNGVRFNQLDVSGTLDLSGGADTLAMNINPYQLRPVSNPTFPDEYGSIPLVNAGTMTGTFENLPTILQDTIGWSEFTGAFTSASALPVNTWFLEQTTGASGGVVFHYKVEGSVPEPGTIGLLAFGLAFIRTARERRRRDCNSPMKLRATERF